MTNPTSRHLQRDIERSVQQSDSLQDFLASQAEISDADRKKDHNSDRESIREEIKYHEKASITHSALKVSSFVSNLLPWMAFGATRIPRMGMFGLSCAACSVFLDLCLKRKISTKLGRWPFYSAKFIDIVSSAFCLKSFLNGPVGWPAKIFTGILSVGQSAISLYGDRCQKKIIKLELNREVFKVRQDQKSTNIKLLSKTFSSSMNSDGAALGLVRQLSIFQDQALENVLKRQ
ncbi:hypothetical protein [Candidatus Similichlamydia epinepheli]|uniref:hypothetical protein n=1 Tax=Candidatus Similichlamydia epinepheli TaxID=1903953 RepID=UPI000D3D85C9|nr:hypothetical protein [Candidatus Similichlamydia epinepheli]